MSTFAQQNTSRSPAPRILLVEDDDDLRAGLAENLRFHGMSVTDVDCAAAFHAARRQSAFDVSILDVNLPDGSGFELAASMAGDLRRPGVIMLTARTGQPDRIRAYTEGADIYMTKPVAGEELLLAVRNLAKRVDAQGTIPSGEKPPTWYLDKVPLQLVSPDGRSLSLSGREFLLIEQFVGKHDHILSRQTLSQTLGYGTHGSESRAFDALLRRLRRKFEVAGLGVPFTTFNNRGIQFRSLVVLK